MAISKRAKNKWQVRIFLGRGADGKRLFHTKTITGLKRDAEKYENDYKRRLSEGSLTPQNYNFNDLVAIYKADYHFTELSKITQRGYSHNLDIASGIIGGVLITEIKPFTLSQLLKRLPAGLSANSKALFWRVLKVILNFAVRMELIPKNPMNSLSPIKKERKDFQFLEQEEIKRFLDACRIDKRYTVFAFAVLSGARPEEYTGLTWDKVNFKKGTVKIEQTAYEGEIRVNTAKTKKSLREIGMPADLMAELRELQQWQKANLVFNPLNLVFPSIHGKIIRSGALYKMLQVLLKEAGIEKHLRVYDLRHTHATFLMSRIGDPKAVADRLGHANASMTLNVYCHTSKNSVDRILNALDNI
ncbi:site-specific integrase [bacterium]|nr:site-specific integrase [bacterium]